MAETINTKQNFLKGIIKDNPVFVMLLGMCPTLGVTSSAFNGLGMGIATLFVLLMSNIVVSLVKTQIPSKVRIPAFIIAIPLLACQPTAIYRDNRTVHIVRCRRCQEHHRTF